MKTTWLQPNILHDLISIKNYNVFRNDNPLNSCGSGACIYVKNIFACKKYENIEITVVNHRKELKMCG